MSLIWTELHQEFISILALSSREYLRVTKSFFAYDDILELSATLGDSRVDSARILINSRVMTLVNYRRRRTLEILGFTVSWLNASRGHNRMNNRSSFFRVISELSTVFMDSVH